MILMNILLNTVWGLLPGKFVAWPGAPLTSFQSLFSGFEDFKHDGSRFPSSEGEG